MTVAAQTHMATLISQWRRWKMLVPVGLAVSCLFIISLATWRQWNSPYESMDWSFRSGLVHSVDPTGPAAGILQQGDRILTIDGVKVAAVHLSYERYRAGDTLHLDILRDGQRRSVLLSLAAPSPRLLIARQIPHLVAIVFWVVGIGVLLFKPKGQPSWLFFFFCQSISIILASGGLGIFGPVWMDLIYGVALGWVGTFATLFHLRFPLPLLIRYQRILTIAVCALAILLSLPDLVAHRLVERSTDTTLITARSLFLAVGLLVGGISLVWSYRHITSSEARRQMGIVVLGGVVAFIPFSVLLVLPFALSLYRQPVIPFEGGFLLLLAIPLTYGYAILNYRFIPLDNYISRGAAYLLLLTFLAGAYFILSALIYRLAPTAILQQPITNVALVLSLATTVTPLFRGLQIFVNKLLYGGWYDYRSAVRQLSQTLGQTEARLSLERSLTQGLETVMRLDCARLLLRNKDGSQCMIDTSCPVCLERGLTGIQLTSNSPILHYFQKRPHPVDGAVLRWMLGDCVVPEQEARILADEHARLWVPLAASGALVGLCILGPKHGDASFDEEDLGILQVVACQASIAIENRELIDKLRQRALMSDKLHQQVLHSREEERKYVARELHDQTIQSLVGLNYHLATLRPSASPDMNRQIDGLQTKVRQTLDNVRQICTQLRPPALDSLGLIAALRSRLRDFESEEAQQTVLRVEGDADRWLPEDVSLCLFRFLQEALINVRKHAAAQRVEVCLQIEPDKVGLDVRDDGVGFAVPTRLEHLVADKHFGLAGLRERLELVDGTFEITSVPGHGTSLCACIPLSTEDSRRML
jgi:signal transduction histidine kinase